MDCDFGEHQTAIPYAAAKSGAQWARLGKDARLRRVAG
jgi:hypothetical protein